MSTPPVAVSSRLRASSSDSSRRFRSSQFGLLATRLREFTNKLGDSCFESDVGLFHAEAPTPLGSGPIKGLCELGRFVIFTLSEEGQWLYVKPTGVSAVRRSTG